MVQTTEVVADERVVGVVLGDEDEVVIHVAAEDEDEVVVVVA